MTHFILWGRLDHNQQGLCCILIFDESSMEFQSEIIIDDQVLVLVGTQSNVYVGPMRGLGQNQF